MKSRRSRTEQTCTCTEHHPDGDVPCTNRAEYILQTETKEGFLCRRHGRIVRGMYEPGQLRPLPRAAPRRAQTSEQRRAAGRVRVVVWLTAEEQAALEALREGRSVRDTLGALLTWTATERAARRRAREEDDARYEAAMRKLRA